MSRETLDTKTIIARGYRITSRKFCMAARVDRPDWEEYCKANMYPVSADWYRRCLSHDKITVTPSQVRAIPNSGDDEIGYVEIKWGAP